MPVTKLEFHSLSMSFGVIGFILNIVQITLICRQKKKKSAFLLTILSLSFADGFCALAVLIYEIYWFLAVHGIILQSILFSWIFLGIVIFSQTVSFGHLTFIALERFVAVFYPMRLADVFSRKSCILGLAAIWFLSAIPSVVFQLTHKLHAFKLIIQMCALSLIIFYTAICIKVNRRPKFVTPRNGVSSQRSKNRKLVIHSLSVTLGFIICAFPYCLSDLEDRLNLRIPLLLLNCNSSIDPLLYFLLQYCTRRRKGDITASSLSSEKNKDRFSVNRAQQLISRDSEGSKAVALHLTKRLDLRVKMDTLDQI